MSEICTLCANCNLFCLSRWIGSYFVIVIFIRSPCFLCNFPTCRKFARSAPIAILVSLVMIWIVLSDCYFHSLAVFCAIFRHVGNLHVTDYVVTCLCKFPTCRKFARSAPIAIFFAWVENWIVLRDRYFYLARRASCAIFRHVGNLHVTDFMCVLALVQISDMSDKLKNLHALRKFFAKIIFCKALNL